MQQLMLSLDFYIILEILGCQKCNQFIIIQRMTGNSVCVRLCLCVCVCIKNSPMFIYIYIYIYIYKKQGVNLAGYLRQLKVSYGLTIFTLTQFPHGSYNDLLDKQKSTITFCYFSSIFFFFFNSNKIQVLNHGQGPVWSVPCLLASFSTFPHSAASTSCGSEWTFGPLPVLSIA